MLAYSFGFCTQFIAKELVLGIDWVERRIEFLFGIQHIRLPFAFSFPPCKVRSSLGLFFSIFSFCFLSLFSFLTAKIGSGVFSATGALGVGLWDGRLQRLIST
jgi:hypothetical protein